MTAFIKCLVEWVKNMVVALAAFCFAMTTIYYWSILLMNLSYLGAWGLILSFIPIIIPIMIIGYLGVKND